ncbi:MAG: hemerythrin domain-containing protein [Rhodospirillales bacterium]
MTRIVTVLRHEHGNIARLLKALERQMGILERAGEPDHDIIEGVIDYFLSYPDLYHHPKEELVFGRLCERDPAAANIIGDLKHEHENLAAKVRALASRVRVVCEGRATPGAGLTQLTREFVDCQLRHLEREERVFFPRALEALTDQDWAQLEARMTDEDDPLFGSDVGQRYQALHHDIIEWERQHDHR